MTPIHLRTDGSKLWGEGYTNMLLWLAFMDVKGMMNWIFYWYHLIQRCVWMNLLRKETGSLWFTYRCAAKVHANDGEGWGHPGCHASFFIDFHQYIDVTCLHHLTFVGRPRYLVLGLGRTAGLLYDPDQRCCLLHLQILWWNLRLWEGQRCGSPGSKTANPQKAWFHLATPSAMFQCWKHQPKSLEKNDAVCSFYV